MATNGSILTIGLGESLEAEVAATLERSGNHKVARQLRLIDEPFDETQVGCVLARLDADGPQSVELLDDLADRRSPLAVVFLVERGAVKPIVQAMRRGAFEVLEWPLEQDRLNVTLDQALVASLEKQRRLVETQRVRHRLAELTSGEREVLELMLSGKVNKIIAKQLGIAVRTVETRRNRMFTKLGTRSLPELAAVFGRANMVDDLNNATS